VSSAARLATDRRAVARFFARPDALPLGAVLLGVGLCAVLAVGFLNLDRLPLTACMFKAVTGIPCPTCGATRAVGQLAHLDAVAALSMNPLIVLAGALVVPWGLADLALLPRGRALRVEFSPGAARVLRVAAVAAVVLNWVYLLAVGR